MCAQVKFYDAAEFIAFHQTKVMRRFESREARRKLKSGKTDSCNTGTIPAEKKGSNGIFSE